MPPDNVIAALSEPAQVTREALLALLRDDDPATLDQILALADATRAKHAGVQVRLRGLIEFSNRCQRSCHYCGLRVENNLPRYRMSQGEILDCVAALDAFGYDTVVLQSGEDENLQVGWLTELITEIKARYGLPVTLSVGERSIQDYAKWRASGADRVLLKFETSETGLFQRIHPPQRRVAMDRLALLNALGLLGYQLGSGIMVGLPGQSVASLAQDLVVMRDLNLHMISVGPYIANALTPLGKTALAQAGRGQGSQVAARARIDRTRKMIALTRILNPQAHMPATTAVSVSQNQGLELAMQAGADVVMMNLTPARYRQHYSIYPAAQTQAESDSHQAVLTRLRALGRVLSCADHADSETA